MTTLAVSSHPFQSVSVSIAPRLSTAARADGSANRSESGVSLKNVGWGHRTFHLLFRDGSYGGFHEVGLGISNELR